MFQQDVLHIPGQRPPRDGGNPLPDLSQLVNQPLNIRTRSVDELGDLPLGGGGNDLLEDGLHLEKGARVVLVDEGTQLGGYLLRLVEELDDVGVLALVDLREYWVFEHVDRLEDEEDRLDGDDGLSKVVAFRAFFKNGGVGKIHTDQISTQTSMLNLHILKIVPDRVPKLYYLLLQSLEPLLKLYRLNQPIDLISPLCLLKTLQPLEFLWNWVVQQHPLHLHVPKHVENSEHVESESFEHPKYDLEWVPVEHVQQLDVSVNAFDKVQSCLGDDNVLVKHLFFHYPDFSYFRGRDLPVSQFVSKIHGLFFTVGIWRLVISGNLVLVFDPLALLEVHEGVLLGIAGVHELAFWEGVAFVD